MLQIYIFRDAPFSFHLLSFMFYMVSLFLLSGPSLHIFYVYPIPSNFRDHSNFVNCIRYAPDGSKFISVSSDKKGLIYDGKTGDKIGELSSEGSHTGSIYAVSWSPDSKQVISH